MRMAFDRSRADPEDSGDLLRGQVRVVAQDEHLALAAGESVQAGQQAAYAGSFEGQTTRGLGVRALLPFQVLTLTGPPGW
jgi:hypothetical protein